MKKKYLPILTLIVTLMFVNIACSLSTTLLGSETEEPTRIIPVSTQAAQEFEQAFANPTVDANAGTQTVQINEEQITSYLANQLAQDPNPVLRNPQVYFENNQIVLNGDIVTDVITSPGTLVATVSVDQGKPKINIVSAQVGDLPVPTELLGVVTDMFDRAIRDNLNDPSNAYQVKTITIADHLMTIVMQK